MKLKWTNHCVLSGAGADNDNDNSNNIIFTIKDPKLYVSVVTLPAKHNQKLSKLLSKRFKILVHWNEYKIKSGIKDTPNEYRFFLEPNFVGVSKLFLLVYSNRVDNAKIYKAKRYYLPKCIIKN